MSELPKGWTEVTIGDIIELKYGKALPKKSRRSGPVQVLGSSGEIDRHNAPLLEQPTLVIGRKGSIGTVFKTTGPSWPIDTTYFVRHDPAVTDLTWLYYRLKAVGLSGMNKSVAIPGLNREDAYRVKIPLPPLEEQRRIATILDQATQLIKLNDDFRNVQRRSRSSIFNRVFGDPAINPKRWPTKQLGDISTRFSDGPFGSNLKSEHYTDNGVRVIRLQNIGVGEFIDADRAYITEEHFESIDKHSCVPGDIVIGTLGDPNLRATEVPPHIPLAINKADCVQLRTDDKFVNNAYVLGLLNHSSTERMASKLVLGQTRGRISMGRLKKMEVPVPPMELQVFYADALKALESTNAGLHGSSQIRV